MTVVISSSVRGVAVIICQVRSSTPDELAPPHSRDDLVCDFICGLGLVGGLAPVFTDLHHLTASQTALLVAVPVLLGSVARLPMGMLTDRYGGRAMFVGGDEAVIWPAAVASLLCFLLNAGLYRYLRRLEK